MTTYELQQLARQAAEQDDGLVAYAAEWDRESAELEALAESGSAVYLDGGSQVNWTHLRWCAVVCLVSFAIVVWALS